MTNTYPDSRHRRVERLMWLSSSLWNSSIVGSSSSCCLPLNKMPCAFTKCSSVGGSRACCGFGVRDLIGSNKVMILSRADGKGISTQSDFA
jgi:hypothetical protein